MRIHLIICVALSFVGCTVTSAPQKKAAQIDEAFLISELISLGTYSSLNDKIAISATKQEVLECFDERMRSNTIQLITEVIASSLTEDELDRGYQLSSVPSFKDLNPYILKNRSSLKNSHMIIGPRLKLNQFMLLQAAESVGISQPDKIALDKLLKWEASVSHKIKPGFIKMFSKIRADNQSFFNVCVNS